MQLSRFVSTVALATALGTTLLAAGCGSSPTRSSAGEVIDDTVITSKVKAAFVKDEVVDALDIQVETYKGTVQLSGFANSGQEANRAVELARGVQGVQKVRNDIQLKSGK